jgi:hypothetical protein|tara:strand:- start:521 stop:697 length:177 start_codon:yes stop_codon:yes gene_type:complete
MLTSLPSAYSQAIGTVLWVDKGKAGGKSALEIALQRTPEVEGFRPADIFEIHKDQLLT